MIPKEKKNLKIDKTASQMKKIGTLFTTYDQHCTYGGVDF